MRCLFQIFPVIPSVEAVDTQSVIEQRLEDMVEVAGYSNERIKCLATTLKREKKLIFIAVRQQITGNLPKYVKGEQIETH